MTGDRQTYHNETNNRIAAVRITSNFFFNNQLNIFFFNNSTVSKKYVVSKMRLCYLSLFWLKRWMDKITIVIQEQCARMFCIHNSLFIFQSINSLSHLFSLSSRGTAYEFLTIEAVSQPNWLKYTVFFTELFKCKSSISHINRLIKIIGTLVGTQFQA